MTEVDALQGLVRAEDAAVFGLSGYGGRLAHLSPGSPSALALREADDRHRSRREDWAAALRARGAPVPAAEPAYALTVTASAAQAGVAAAGLESRCATAYASALDALADRTLRTQVVAALAESARRSARLGLLAGQPAATATSALPGLAQPG